MPMSASTGLRSQIVPQANQIQQMQQQQQQQQQLFQYMQIPGMDIKIGAPELVIFPGSKRDIISKMKMN